MDSQSSDVNALGDALHESLNIHVQVSEPASDGHEGEEDIHEWKATCPKKHLIKSETFPYPKLRLPPNSSSDEEGEEDEEPETISQGLHSEESNDHAYPRSISLPVSSHLFAKLVTESVYIYTHTHTLVFTSSCTVFSVVSSKVPFSFLLTKYALLPLYLGWKFF